MTLAGFFQGLTSPLFYELSAELIYPVKEGGKGAETGERERARGVEKKRMGEEKRDYCASPQFVHPSCSLPLFSPPTPPHTPSGMSAGILVLLLNFSAFVLIFLNSVLSSG